MSLPPGLIAIWEISGRVANAATGAGAAKACGARNKLNDATIARKPIEIWIIFIHPPCGTRERLPLLRAFWVLARPSYFSRAASATEIFRGDVGPRQQRLVSTVRLTHAALLGPGINALVCFT